MRFWRYLSEYKYFKSSSDRDFPYSERTPVIVFKPNEVYKKVGETHGEFSHSIKHFKEFLSSKQDFIFNSFENILSNKNYHYYLAKFNKQGNIVRIMDTDFDIRQKTTIDMLLTTLDLIQDKVINKIKLMDVEQELYDKIYDVLRNEYNKVAHDLIDKAIYLDENVEAVYKNYIESPNNTELKKEVEELKSKVNSTKIIKFEHNSRNRLTTLVYNFNDSTLIVMESLGKVGLTMYKMIKTQTTVADAKNALLNKYPDIKDWIVYFMP